MTLANKITIARIIAVPVFIALMLYYTPGHDEFRWAALTVYIIAEISDVVDGYIARNFKQKTLAGSILDPFADKALFISALLCLYHVGHEASWAVQLPLWLVVAFIARDTILVLGSLLLQIHFGALEIKPNIWGKLTAFLQVACVVAVFVQWHMALWMWWAALGVTIISGIIYMHEGIKRLNNGRH
ncbi:MAG: CDP-alcohol phosphatidyltransferase family protein [Candidatus Omnitrophica bacterium]|nr:CDP-alcohol phosphatidyltransferase family protein [Candidatus Omnitrophota bacterium]